MQYKRGDVILCRNKSTNKLREFFVDAVDPNKSTINLREIHRTIQKNCLDFENIVNFQVNNFYCINTYPELVHKDWTHISSKISDYTYTIHDIEPGEDVLCIPKTDNCTVYHARRNYGSYDLDCSTYNEDKPVKFIRSTDFVCLPLGLVSTQQSGLNYPIYKHRRKLNLTCQILYFDNSYEETLGYFDNFNQEKTKNDKDHNISVEKFKIYIKDSVDEKDIDTNNQGETTMALTKYTPYRVTAMQLQLDDDGVETGIPKVLKDGELYQYSGGISSLNSDIMMELAKEHQDLKASELQLHIVPLTQANNI